MSHDPNVSPLNSLPPVVVILVLAILAVEVIFQAANFGLIGGADAAGWRLEALKTYGFREPQFDWMIDNRQFRWEFAYGILTYPFVNFHFTNLLFSLVFILALGKMVGELFSSAAFLIVFFGASIMGAIAYGLIWDTSLLLYGAMPGAYGLIGAYSFLIWTRLTGTGENRMKAFTLIGFLMGLQLFWGLIFAGTYDWVADLAGFFAGFLLSFVVSPGGWGRVLGALRQR